MKKTSIKWFSLLFLAVMGLSLAACGGDDDNDNNGNSQPGNLDTPKFEASSARYTITDHSSLYESIEFTASGNYMITQRESVSAPRLLSAPQEDSRRFLGRLGTTRSYGTYDNIIYGTYTKNGDTYVLDGFGTIVVTGGGSNAVSLDITTNGGSKVTVGAQRDQQYNASSKTNMLCRTWKFDQIKLLMKAQGQTLIDKTFSSYREFAIAMLGYDGETVDEDDIKEMLAEEPKQVIFTKSGTYIVFYANGTLAVSTWKWQNETTGEARYSWNYEYIDDPSRSGVINIAFSGSQLVIKEYLNREGYDDAENYGVEGYVEYVMSEVK